MKVDNKVILQKIKDAAIEYKTNYVNKSFLYIFENTYIEVLFKKESFSHLTGVSRITGISAKDFFQKAVEKKLSIKHFGFDNNHPANLCFQKLFFLNDLQSLVNSEVSIFQNIKTDSIEYSLGIGEVHYTLCLIEQDGYYIPRSLYCADCSAKSDNVFKVYAILCKDINSKLYDNINFHNGTKLILSDELKSKITDDVFNSLTGC